MIVSKQNRVIITAFYYDYHYKPNKLLPKHIHDFVYDLKQKYKWALTVVQSGDITQGVLETDDINIGVNIANEIYNRYKYTVTVVSVGEIEIDDSPLFSAGSLRNSSRGRDVNANCSKGLVENGRYLDTLIEKKEIGIFYK
jgi:predicted Ser/Thr protein kinase